MKQRSRPSTLTALGTAFVTAFLPAMLPSCSEADEEQGPVYETCPAGMIQISEASSSGADASVAPLGVYDLTMKDSVQGGVNAIIVRKEADVWRTEWSLLERLGLTAYRVRLETPRIGNYRVDAYAIFTVDGQSCIGSERREFSIANPSPVADASSDASPDADAIDASSEEAPDGPDAGDGSESGSGSD